jgi:hypothetical protein
LSRVLARDTALRNFNGDVAARARRPQLLQAPDESFSTASGPGTELSAVPLAGPPARYSQIFNT